MNDMPAWHPMVVHFPLALTLTATACLVAARLLRRATWAATLATVGTWNLCLAAISILFALATGLAAVIGLDVSVAARQAISLHMKWAMLTALLILLLAVWRGAGMAQESRPSWLFVVILFCATGAAIVTGYRGGENVYRFGVAVQR